ncbi:MAG: hypothetical protein IPM98_17570 [Lewinellaceae bacterium]|nr:hypothetical protein [Lewinellaceae bacterium]
MAFPGAGAVVPVGKALEKGLPGGTGVGVECAAPGKSLVAAVLGASNPVPQISVARFVGAVGGSGEVAEGGVECAAFAGRFALQKAPFETVCLRRSIAREQEDEQQQ